MDRKQITEKIENLYRECPGNVISPQDAICPEVEGLVMFESPLIGVGTASDELFDRFKDPGIVGPWFMKPTEWLKGAKTVISLFFPFTDAVKKGNRTLHDGPSPAWLHGRIEGQNFLAAYIAELQKWFEANGVKTCVPLLDERFQKVVAGNHFSEYDGVDVHTFGSNWSERHAAFVCGLGTFGLSKGLITEKGMAGRCASIIIEEELEADVRPCTDIYEYCIQCGVCIKRCPAQAISYEEGKDHNRCNAWLQELGKIHAPRFGCGLCQTAVPCESRNPVRKR